MSDSSHAPRLLKGISWPVCRKCGLVYLKNPLTAWCIKMGCDYADKPNFKAVVQQFTGAKP